MTTEPAYSDESISDQLPSGYRQGILAAIAIITGFTLSFIRYWSFEDNGNWTDVSIYISLGILLSLIFQLSALWRALQLEDSCVENYRKTLRVFFASVFILMISVLIGVIYKSGSIPFKFVLLDNTIESCMYEKLKSKH